MDLKEALKVLLEEEHIGDFVYTVRERAVTQAFADNSWEHPRVIRYSDAVVYLTSVMKGEI